MRLKLIPRVRVNYTITDLWNALFTSEKTYSARDACKTFFSDYFEGEEVCLVPSARDAIYELLIRLPHKRVVIPAYTCIAVVEAVKLANKDIIFSRSSYGFNSDYIDDIVDSCIVVATHQYGLPCNIEKIAKKCREKKSVLIEDCATSIGTIVKRKKTGVWGDYAVVSFNASKLLNVPPFGGVLISKDKQMIDNIKNNADWKKTNLSFKVKGLVRGLAFVITKNVYFYRLFHYLTIQSKGKIQKTEHEKPSEKKTALYSYRFSEWQAFILLQQLKRLNQIFEKRRSLYQCYDENIVNPLVKKPTRVDDAVCCRYAVLVDRRNDFYKECVKRGVDMDFSHCSLGCPESYEEEHKMARQILNIPFNTSLTEKEVQKIISVVNSIKLQR